MIEYEMWKAWNIIRKNRMGASSILVYLRLAFSQAQDGECCDTSTPTLQQQTQLAERTIRYALRDLEARGLIEPVTRRVI